MGLMSLAGVISLVLAIVLATRVRRCRPFLAVPGILTGFAGLGAFVLADSVAIYAIVVALGFACWFYLPAASSRAATQKSTSRVLDSRQAST